MSDIRKAIRDAMRELSRASFQPRDDPLMLLPGEYKRLKQLGVDVTRCRVIKPIPTKEKPHGYKRKPR